MSIYERNFFLRSISHFSDVVNLNTLLFGSDALPYRDNKQLFLHVRFYIKESKRLDLHEISLSLSLSLSLSHRHIIVSFPLFTVNWPRTLLLVLM